MGDQYSDNLNELSKISEKSNPTKEEQFKLKEIMNDLRQETPGGEIPEVFSYNLAMEYMDRKEFSMAKRLFEIGAKTGDWTCKQGLGIIWYYGLCGEQDYKKAYMYFEERRFGRSAYLLADMYHYGYYVQKDLGKCREILEYLFNKAIQERYDGRSYLSTLYPEVSLRLAKLNIEEGKATLFDLDGLYNARKTLAIRQKIDPSWMNILTMRSILETIKKCVGREYIFWDIYDFMIFDYSNVAVNFMYNGQKYRLDIVTDKKKKIYHFQDESFYGPDEFLEKAKIEDKLITTVYDEISDILIKERRSTEKLITPFGEIKILIDGKETSYTAEEGRKWDVLCPHVLGRYQITVQFTPDGKKHTIACVFQPICSYKKTSEGGERLECQSFYNNQRFKMSIGLECEAGYVGGVRVSDEYDYDADYLENGMAFLIETNTKTERYVFGISWIDNVGWDDPIDDNNDRDVETWNGADPSLAL